MTPLVLRILVIALLVVALAPARAEIPRNVASLIRAEADRVGLDPVLLVVEA